MVTQDISPALVFSCGEVKHAELLFSQAVLYAQPKRFYHEDQTDTFFESVDEAVRNY